MNLTYLREYRECKSMYKVESADWKRRYFIILWFKKKSFVSLNGLTLFHWRQMEFNLITDGRSGQTQKNALTSRPSVFFPPVSHSQVSPKCQEVLMENVTRPSERSQTAQNVAGEASTESDLLENIWKLENLFQNHSEWLQRLEILIRVQQSSTQCNKKWRHC